MAMLREVTAIASVACLIGCTNLANKPDVLASISPPIVDGVIGPEEWAGARRERLTGGGEMLLLRAGSELYVAVIGPGLGFPSLCIGDFGHVEILHASAALGSVSYTRANTEWRRGKPFEWRVRDVPEPTPTLSAERASFRAEYRWLANASHIGSPSREYQIELGPERQFLGVVFLSTKTMEAAYWPASMSDGCRDLSLLRGDAPDALRFDPSQWHKID